jgi:hypothetical protein
MYINYIIKSRRYIRKEGKKIGRKGYGSVATCNTGQNKRERENAKTLIFTITIIAPITRRAARKETPPN